MSARKFLIVGSHRIQGKATGEIVELELTNDQILALVQGGHIEEVHDDPKPVEEAPEDTSGPEPLFTKGL